MKFDNVLSEINGFGKFQTMIVLIQSLSRMTLPCHFLLNNFIAAVPSHHCDLSALEDEGVFGNLTQEQRLTVSIPVQEDGTPSSCKMFPEPQFNLLSNFNDSDLATVTCQNGWVYDNSTFKSTLATEWDLVCERKWMNKATATIFFIGVMCGAPLFGFLSDRFGRRAMLMVAYLATMVFAFTSAFSTSYVMFCIMRFFTGVTLSGISIISIVLSVEWFDIQHRTFAGVIVSLDWTGGNMLLASIAYFVNDWRWLTIAVTSPLVLAVITWWWLPESARWLLANGEKEKAHFYLEKCAKMNNRSKCMAEITPQTLTNAVRVKDEEKKYGFVDLVRTPNIRKLAICTGILWYGVAFTYYGISLNITGFGMNVYFTQFIYAAIELPGKIMVYYFLNKFGRKPGQVGTLLLTGTCVFINIFVPQGLWVFRTIVGLFGKGLSEASFTIMFLYTTELYPTVVRQNGVGYTSFVGRLGVSIAPLIALLDVVWELLPAVIYALVAVGTGLVALLLPETLNVRLPEFIEDIEKPRAELDGESGNPLKQADENRNGNGTVEYYKKSVWTKWKMKFEHLLSDINGFGRFQIMIIIISFVARFTLPCHFMLGNFIAAVPSHRCDLSTLDDEGVFGNLTQEQRLTVTIPVQEDGTPSSCKMFPEPQFHLLSNSIDSDLATVPCQNGWVYDNSTFKSTLATEWDLVCDQKGQNKATATIFFLGVMFGAMTFGSLSDRFGRKTMLLVSYISGMLFGVASAFSTSFIMFAVLRFFTGFGITGIVIISSVLSVEWVDIEHRKLVGVIDSLSWTFGNSMIPAIAYCVNDWRQLTIVVTSPLVLAILTWRWIPESARWLIANGKFEKANFYLQQCAQINQKQEFASKITPETLSSIVVTERKDRTYSYLDLVRTPKMRRLALLTGIVWYGVASTYYGISFNITGFGLNIYLTQFVYGAIELPVTLSVYYLLDKVGRRNTEVGSLLGAGICLAINIFLPRDMSVLRTVVAMLGKGCSAASFTTVVLYSSELFPTVVRQNGMGYNSSMGRLGVSLAPLILLLDEVWRDLPQVLLCSIALLASLVARMLPETRDRCLPETIQDIEDGQTGKSLAGSQVVETTEIPLKSKANDEGEN